LDDPGIATAETGEELDDAEAVGFDTAPANDRDVDGDVVVIDVGFAGAAVAVVEVTGVESLL
jgi:hypothetical protein